MAKTEQPATPPPPSSPAKRISPAETAPPLSSTGPLIAWLGVQLAALILAAARVPLAAKYPEPAERFALHLLFATQIVTAALLFPFLMRGWRATAQVIATALPFQLAAAYLAGVEIRSVVDGAIAIALWMVGLGIWENALRTPPSRMLGVAVASCLTLGGGLLGYLRLEFAPDSSSNSNFETASPLFTALISIESSPPRIGWIFLSAILIFGLLARGMRKLRRA